MKQLVNSLIILSIFAIIGCSEKTQEQSVDAAGQDTVPQADQAAASEQQQPAANQSSGDQYQLPTEGKVLKAMHAGGYTYMEVENHGKRFWIAATMMNVKRNDHIKWSDAAVMQNFTSSTLRRTFDEILFVTAAQVE
jgi:hypothetical protein